MPIKINVPFQQKDDAKKMGAIWVPDAKTWVIPENVKNINLFKLWLPKDGTIVKYPYILAHSSRTCWKCHKVTPVIGLGAKNYFTTVFSVDWEKHEHPFLFVDIRSMDNDLSAVLEERFPFFRQMYIQKFARSHWVNTCINCQTVQGDDYNINNYPFSGKMGKLFEFTKTELLSLRFDYHIDAAIYEGEYHYDGYNEID